MGKKSQYSLFSVIPAKAGIQTLRFFEKTGFPPNRWE